MPARDQFHDTVRNALIKDGWAVTHDPIWIKYGNRDFYVDLGAESLLAADKGNQRIAVEIKSFTGLSEMADLEMAVGQFVIYHDMLAELDPSRELYLAVPDVVVENLFNEPIGQLLLKNRRIAVFGVNPGTEEVTTWVK